MNCEAAFRMGGGADWHHLFLLINHGMFILSWLATTMHKRYNDNLNFAPCFCEGIDHGCFMFTFTDANI